MPRSYEDRVRQDTAVTVGHAVQAGKQCGCVDVARGMRNAVGGCERAKLMTQKENEEQSRAPANWTFIAVFAQRSRFKLLILPAARNKGHCAQKRLAGRRSGAHSVIMMLSHMPSYDTTEADLVAGTQTWGVNVTNLGGGETGAELRAERPVAGTPPPDTKSENTVSHLEGLRILCESFDYERGIVRVWEGPSVSWGEWSTSRAWISHMSAAHADRYPRIPYTLKQPAASGRQDKREREERWAGGRESLLGRTLQSRPTRQCRQFIQVWTGRRLRKGASHPHPSCKMHLNCRQKRFSHRHHPKNNKCVFGQLVGLNTQTARHNRGHKFDETPPLTFITIFFPGAPCLPCAKPKPQLRRATHLSNRAVFIILACKPQGGLQHELPEANPCVLLILGIRRHRSSNPMPCMDACGCLPAPRSLSSICRLCQTHWVFAASLGFAAELCASKVRSLVGFGAPPATHGVPRTGPPDENPAGVRFKSCRSHSASPTSPKARISFAC